jgi:predicted nicotinamide N-methyase
MGSISTTRRALGLKILNSSHRDIKRLKQEGHVAELHGNKFWNSSFLLMNHLKRHPLKKHTRVLEIGCGWGLLGIFCARNFSARVTGVDADKNVFPFLNLHSELNGVKIETQQNSFEHLTKDWLSNFDVILGSDICFWDDMSIILFNLIRRALKAGVKQIIISDPCRAPFTELANRCHEKLPDAHTVSRRMSRPVRASGELLIIDNV